MAYNPHWVELPPNGPMSLDDYLRLDQISPNARYEYLDGIARMMSGGSYEHDKISRNVTYALENNFLSGPCTVFGSDMQVLLGEKADGKKHYVYPDATISCDVTDRRRGNKRVRSPRIAIEVLSPSTEALDRSTKLAAYQACPTIQEVVLISQFAQHIEIYRRDPEGMGWTYSGYDAGAEVELASVDVQLSMEGIYRGINFDEPLLGEDE